MNHQADTYLFADELTQSRLREPSPRVLLLGGYLGYPNFGDILQLQGTIDWHRSGASAVGAGAPLEPVVICDAGSITDPHLPDRLRLGFGVSTILFASQSASPPALAPSLAPLASAAPISYLHLYGGGYLNRLWGPHILQTAEHLIDFFGVGHYVMSGQQAEASFLDPLRSHVARCRPLLAGGRDDDSVRTLEAADAPAAYSFDDAAERMVSLADRVRPRLDGPASSAAPRALIHLNVSPYAAKAADALGTLLERVTQLIDSGTATPDPSAPALAAASDHILLNAYNDPRVAHVADTLGVVLRAGDRFPLSTYRVLHLAAESLVASAACSPTSTDAPNALAFVCSYHAAMLCQLLNIPVWLEVRNEYYAQKAAGLGLRRTDSLEPAEVSRAFAEFLRVRPLAHLDFQRRRRSAWLDRLAAAYSIAPAAPPLPSCRAAPALRDSTPSPEPAPTQHASADTRIRELQSWIDQLETGKAWLTRQFENYRDLSDRLQAANQSLAERGAALDAQVAELAAQSQHQQARIASLTRDLEARIAEANRAREDLQAAMNRIAQLQGGIDWLQPQYASWKARAAELHAYVEELLPALKRADDARADSQAAVASLKQENAALAARLRELEASQPVAPP